MTSSMLLTMARISSPSSGVMNVLESRFSVSWTMKIALVLELGDLQNSAPRRRGSRRAGGTAAARSREP
jgi:hypothetical protein